MTIALNLLLIIFFALGVLLGCLFTYQIMNDTSDDYKKGYHEGLMDGMRLTGDHDG